MVEYLLTDDSKCPKCGLKTLEKDGEDLHCWSCGTTFYHIPENPGYYTGPVTDEIKDEEHAMNREEIMKRHRYYEDNKAAILADYNAIGHQATCKKWNIPPGSLSQIITRWKSDVSKGPDASLDTYLMEPLPVPLPAFPPFSNDWVPNIQDKWLSIYERLATKLLDRRKDGQSK
jgi:hypothetical protein